jgi:uncharacterized protein (DUF885 family)
VRYLLLLNVLPLVLSAIPPRSPHADDGERLHALFREIWEFRLAEDPVFATSVGDNRSNDKLPSMTIADLTRRAKFERDALARLTALDRTQFAPQDRVSADVLEWDLRARLGDFDRGAWRCSLTSDWGFHMEFAQLPSAVPLRTTKDYENYVARLRDFPRYAREHVALLREGLRTGFTLPRVALEGYDATIRAHVVDGPTRSALYAPLRDFPASVPAADHERLRAAGAAAVAEAVVPAFRDLLDFFTKDYLPGARRTIAAADLPNGRDYYAHCVRKYTTLDVSAEDVHQLGLREVARIRSEMEDVIRETKFEGDFAAFVGFLRTDPRFYPKSGEELLERASFIAKRVDGELPRLFGKLPRLPYGVKPVPSAIAPKFTGGRYEEPPADGSRAGFYWVNTYKPESRPLYILEALTLHEAVPGHHLQIALQRELRDLPDFRRTVQVDAFSEGWALYAERLGLEAGCYRDPYSNFGRLTYEMWRACRLVVDTGIHQLGWSRQKAVDFLASNTALSLHEVNTETDRYIAWPGQALAYKMGELQIRELRARTETALGPGFDLRAFHDAILANGPVPLTVLAGEIDGFIAARRRA